MESRGRGWFWRWRLPRRHWGVALLGLLSLAGGAAWWISSRPRAPEAVCQTGFPAAIAVEDLRDVALDQQADVAVRVRACTRALAEAGILVSAPGRGGFTIDVPSSDPPCPRAGAGESAVILACGPLARGEERQMVLRIVPHREIGLPATAMRAVFSLVSASTTQGGVRSEVMGSVTTALGVRTASGGVPGWFWVLDWVIAMAAGVDMSRRGRNGVGWALGVYVFNVFGLAAWLRARACWLETACPASLPGLAVAVEVVP